MSNFKKIFGLAGAVMVFTGLAYGQANCSASSILGKAIRAEGTNELVGDLLIKCTNTNNTGLALAASTINIQVFANSTYVFTSKVLDATSGATEAVAWIGNAAGVPAKNTTPVNAYNAAAAVSGTVGNNGGVLNFIGLPTPALAANTTDFFTIEISNLRVDASKVAVPAGAPTTVSLTAVVNGSTIQQASLSGQQVAVSELGLGSARSFKEIPTKLATIGSNNFVVCSTIQPTTAIGTGNATTNIAAGSLFTLQVAEGFTTAFKTLADEASPIPMPGAGYPTQGPSKATTGSNAANSGTRFKVTFTNVPAGVTLYTVAGAIASSTSTAVATLTTGGEAGANAPVTSPTTLNSFNGFAPVGGTAVFEITTDDLSLLDTFAVQFFAVATPNSVAATATPITATVSLAPTGNPTLIPNFSPAAASVTTIKTSTFAACTTSLLFPFVTNQLGFDTGLAIANTSTDPFGANGAVAQSGTCTLNFYGSGAPSPATGLATPNVPTGTVYTQVLSNVAAGFQDYLIAQCNFQYAHGFAFITDGVGSNGGLSQGYLAGVIPDVNQQGRPADPSGKALSGSGETLGN